jgi:hypothetical protein
MSDADGDGDVDADVDADVAAVRRGGRAHHAVLTALVALDPVTLVASLVYAAVAAATGAALRWDTRRAMLVCTGVRARIHGGGGTTVGFVYVTSSPFVDDRVRFHESRHRDQWAIAGPLFAVLYAGELLRCKGDFTRNVWERWAGLTDGGYVSPRTG